jgi:ABC-2 type transport system permease protein
MFISPISRYSIVMGKIMGESLVALAQGVGITAFAALIGVPFSLASILGLIPVAIMACLLGGAFGMVVLGNVNSQRAAAQVFPFIFLPQFFLAGVFNPIRELPLYLDVLSRISPLRYSVDFARGMFYRGDDDYGRVVLASPLFNLTVMAGLFVVFMAVGTALFVRREQNR